MESRQQASVQEFTRREKELEQRSDALRAAESAITEERTRLADEKQLHDTLALAQRRESTALANERAIVEELAKDLDHERRLFDQQQLEWAERRVQSTAYGVGSTRG